jgi:aspyridone synthetase trans-acting enoyl reductase
MTDISSLPASQAALKVVGSNDLAVAPDAALPALEPTEVLVRVACISINQVDSKSADLSPTPGATSGTDFSGVVAALGADVDTDKWHIGDRVMGGIFGNNPLRRDNGAFAEYVAVPEKLLWHVPAAMDFATAASMPAALATVGLSLFRYLEIPMPDANGLLKLASSGEDGTTKYNPTYVLIYGGGTATGAMAIQVLRLLGLAPITTCSPASAQRSVELGASATFDYRSPNCGTEVLEHTAGSLALALDCISSSDSMACCYMALGPAGGRYVALDPFPLRGHTRRSVQPDWICSYTIFGRDIAWAPPFDLDARMDDRATAEEWYVLAQRLLDDGMVVPQPLEVRGGGLAAVGAGMNEVLKGKIKGKKLVYPVAEQLCAA